MPNRRVVLATGAAALARALSPSLVQAAVDRTHLNGLILGPGPPGRCDDFRVGLGVPRWIHDRREWWMWYYARDHAFNPDAPPELGTGRIALATSRHGLNWHRYQGHGAGGSIMEPSTAPSDFDCLHIGLSDICRAEGRYWMWYFGGDHTPSVDQLGESTFGFRMLPGLARSDDGLSWTRVRGRGPGGALVDYGSDLYVAWPNAVHDGTQFILYYTGVSAKFYPFRTLVALSKDGVNWSPQGELQWTDGLREWDANGALTRHVLPNPLGRGPRWLMVYAGIDTHPARMNRRSVCAAVSEDGLAWRHLYDAPIFVGGPPGSWDEHGITGPQLVTAGKELRLYYMGLPPHGDKVLTKGIGLAISANGDLRNFQRYLPPGG